MACRHAVWSRLVDRDYTVQLQVTDRPTRLLDLIRNPNVETPSLVFFVGNRCKDAAMQQLGIETTKEDGLGGIRIFLASTTELTTQPVFVAESDTSMDSRLQGHPPPSHCHEMNEQNLPANFSSKSGHSVMDYMYHRLIFPFADVICLFVDDFGGVANVARRIIGWLTQGEPSQGQALPHLILVAEDETDARILEETSEYLRTQTSMSLYNRFQKISLVYLTTWRRLRYGRDYCLKRWDLFKNELTNSIRCVRRTRAQDRTLYSATHFVEFLKHASSNFNNQVEPFDFIKASRSLIPAATDMDAHLTTFLRGIKSMERLKTFAIPTIASSFILDQYPPNMHGASSKAIGNDPLLITMQFSHLWQHSIHFTDKHVCQ